MYAMQKCDVRYMMHDMHYTIMRRTGNKSSNRGNNLVAMVAREYWAEMGSFGQKWG